MRRGVVKAVAPLGCYATWIASWSPKFRGNMLVPSSRFEQPKNSWTVEDGTEKFVPKRR